MMKKRVAKPIRLPLGIKRLDLIELPGHIALLALDQPWCLPDHYADLGAHIRLAEIVAQSRKNDEIAKILGRAKHIMQSWDNSPEEIAEFRKLIGVTLPWIAQQPNVEIERAALRCLKAYDSSRNSTP